MYQMKATIYVFIFCIAAVGSCKKPGNTNVTGGGKGGHTTLCVSAEHHNELVDTCTFYIKYGTTDAPANNVYDDSAICILTGNTPVATFKNLETGIYYLYGQGYHAAYSPPYIKGGESCTIHTEDTLKVIVPTYSYQP